jgi:hypothetical protein
VMLTVGIESDLQKSAEFWLGHVFHDSTLSVQRGET